MKNAEPGSAFLFGGGTCDQALVAAETITTQTGGCQT
jgi:hypothetical protein